MRAPSRFRSWARGWSEFPRRGDIAAYAGQGVAGRLSLDARALARALSSFGFVGAALACTATALAAQILVWEWDLRGWRRDGLLCLPVLLAAPWVAAARRRHVEALVASAAVTPAPIHERAVTDLPPPPGHSARSGAAERRPWQLHLMTRRRRIPGPVLAGWISCWPSRAWACWRQWRCRASAK